LIDLSISSVSPKGESRKQSLIEKLQTQSAKRWMQVCVLEIKSRVERYIQVMYAYLEFIQIKRGFKYFGGVMNW
jgi:hypothetical protein